jgi:Tfp pilus assembly protein PilN
VHTLAQVKLDLANEEAAEKLNGMIARHEMSPSNFILAVFDIEAKLCVTGLLLFRGANQEISSAALDKRSQKRLQTLTEKASLQIKSNQLHHRMQTLLDVQKIYIPGVASLEAHFVHESARRMGKRHDTP